MSLKKFAALLLVISLISGLCACSEQSAGQVSRSAKDSVSFTEISDEIDSDPVEYMLPAIDAFIEYLHANNDKIDLMGQISSEDYWNIVCVVVGAWSKAYGEPAADKLGMYHLRYALAEDFAKTFMYPFWYRNAGSPNYKISYSVSADPGSGILDLTPLSVDYYDAQIDSLELISEGSYNLRIRMIPHSNESPAQIYRLTLEVWDDDKDHVMPLRVVDVENTGEAPALTD